MKSLCRVGAPRLNLLVQHLRLVDRHLLEPGHRGLELPHPLREVVAVEVGRGLADSGEEVSGDRYGAVLEVGAVLLLQLLLEGLGECRHPLFPYLAVLITCIIRPCPLNLYLMVSHFGKSVPCAFSVIRLVSMF